MEITFKGHHIELTDALKTRAIEKLQHLQHFSSHILNINVTFTVEKNTQKAEATLHIPGSNLHAVAESEDMYNSIDLLYENLKRQLNKHHDKMTDHHHG